MKMNAKSFSLPYLALLLTVNDQTVKVTVANFVDYNTIKTQEKEKLSQEEAEKKFPNLDRDSKDQASPGAARSLSEKSIYTSYLMILHRMYLF